MKLVQKKTRRPNPATVRKARYGLHLVHYGNFTLQPQDEISITIDRVGTLVNIIG